MDVLDITKAEGIFVRGSSGGVFQCSADWDWRANCMSDYDIWLVCGGHGRLDSMGKSWEISAGDCFLATPGTSLYACHNPQTPLSVVSSHFDIVVPQGVELCGLPDFHTRIADFFFIERLLRRRISSLLTGQKSQSDMWLQAALIELVGVGRVNSSVDSVGHYTREINEICAEIAINPQKDYQISTFAARLHVCSDHFTRIFKDTMRISPIDFIINCRIELAKNLLISSSYQISTIAEMAGYKSVYYFSKHFKVKTGQTPTNFRELKAGI